MTAARLEPLVLETPRGQGPPGHWLLGHIPALRNDPLGLLDRCAGDVVPLRLGKTAWLVLDPPDVQHVLEHSETIYSKGQAFRYGRRLYGNSLLVSEGEEHRRQAREVGGLFFRHAAKAFLEPVADITQRWLERWRDGETLDLWSGLVELTLAISSQAIFGRDYLPAWLSGQKDGHVEQILQSYDVAMQHVALQNFSLLPAPDWLPTRENRRYSRAIYTLNSALAAAAERRLAGETGGGLLDHLVSAHRENPQAVTAEQVRDQALVLLLGGYESTATALCWTILLLTRHDSIRGRVQEELRNVVATDLPTTSHVGRLSYLGQVFSESLRLYPPPWLIPRTAARDDVLPTGQRIARGTQVFLSPYRTQRDARCFANPLVFDPERFAPSAPAILPGSYFPFGLGPRHCIGESIARSQASLILATIFRRHELELPRGDLPPSRPLLTLRPQLPLPVRIRRR